jgi:dihydroorotate dehydrogenase
VGTANYLNPMAALEVAEGIEAYARENGLARVADLVGTLEVPAG